MDDMNSNYLMAVIGLTLGCACPGCSTLKDEGPPIMAFAYSDLAGKRLLTAETLDNPTSLVKGIFSGGTVLTTRFSKQQDAADDWNGRQIGANFDKARGSLFQIEGGQIPVEPEAFGGRECLLVNSFFLRERKLLAVKSESNTPIGPDLLRRIEEAKGKKAAWGKSIARIGSKHQLVLVEFVPEGSKCLASLVLAARESLSFMDDWAEYDASVERFVWRVETDGINAEDFKVLAAFETKQEIELAVLWDGGESQNLLLLSDDDHWLHQQFMQSRYWAPI
jgi:hypothetical protein